MFLSIIIPVYNSERYLASCLDACLAQDLPRTDYEIICINDGSTDRSLEILQRYSQEQNVRFLSKENQGCSAARNDGMALAQGDYLWFIDNDDLIASNILGMIRDLICAAGPEIDCFEFPYCSFTDADVRRDGSVPCPPNFDPHGPMIGNALWPQIFRRDFLEHNGLFHRGKRNGAPFYGFGMDTLFLYECRKYGMNTRILLEDRPIYFYRRADHSITTDLSPNAYRARVLEYLDILPILRTYYLDEQTAFGKATSDTANFMMDYVRTLLVSVSQMSGALRREAKAAIEKAGYHPFRQLPECTYTRDTFTAGKHGWDKLTAALRFHVLTPWGLEALTLTNRLSKCILRLRSALRLGLLHRIRNIKHH